jgi:Fe-S-cluster containining protein
MPLRHPDQTDSLDEVRGVYADLEARPVERACMLRTGCCQFKLTGKTPLLTKGEALVAARALRASGRTRLPASRDEAAGACPMLDAQGRCIIYEGRPFGCRTHFCAQAGGPYARRDVLDLIRRLEAVDAALGGDGPHPLNAAVAQALADLA